MARLIGPDESVRTVFLTSGSNKGKAAAQGMSVPLYADLALSIPADVRSTTDAVIPGTPPTLTVDAYSMIPLFKFPDGVDIVYTSIGGGPPVALYARTDERLDTLSTAVTALQPGGAAEAATVTALTAVDTAAVHKTGAETIAGIKTFSSSPLVPTPTTASQAATKAYADGLVDDLSGVSNAVAARTALGLGDSATRSVGTASGTVAAGDDTRIVNAAPKGFAQIAPSMTVYETQANALRKVLYHFGTTLYGATQDATGTVYKSTDTGATWTAKGNIGFNPQVLMRIETTGTLLAVAPNPTPTVKRSTDDGTTWTTVTTLNFAPINSQGITETPSGYVLIAEYGNVGNTVYRVMRSTDDGQTFTAALSSSGTAPASDPGHVHSVTYDKVAGRFVAYLDYAQPQLFSSTDQGATWTLIGTSNTLTKPNFVGPMYFPNYVAWGYDNEANGRIARLPRADFYAGNWDNVELVAQVNRKVFYGSFPIADGVWVVSQATETVGAITGGPGSYAQEIYIVDNDGARVAGGIEHASPTVKAGTQLGQRGMFPAFNYNVNDHGGVSWVNLNAAALPREFASVPYSVGSRPPMVKTSNGALHSWILPEAAALSAPDNTGVPRELLAYSTNRTSLRNSISAAGPELRIYETNPGRISFIFGGALHTSAMSDGRLQLAPGIYLELGSAAGSPRVLGGSGTPEGAVSAPVGSMFLRSDGGAGTCLYIKESGTGNTGWVAK